jgi:predicted DNA-binding mobile mystery protein A
MSSYELAERMHLSPTRVRQFETAEVAGSIRLSTLRRAAEALNCRLIYVFAPNEPLELMVERQARSKAAKQLSISDPDALYDEEQEEHLELQEDLEKLTEHFVDRQGLWSQPRDDKPDRILSDPSTPSGNEPLATGE